MALAVKHSKSAHKDWVNAGRPGNSSTPSSIQRRQARTRRTRVMSFNISKPRHLHYNKIMPEANGDDKVLFTI